MQKDKLIESLRLELAESQIKLVEMENKGGGRQRELEKELLEARMANARLMEDNESYQLLLSERTLNGDFTKGDFMREVNPDNSEAKESSGGLGSLADELESVDARVETDDTRKLESEIKMLKDQNKALTLYIERIISRVLQHEGFETILDKNENDPPAKQQAADSNKDLPPTPTEKDDASQPSFLQRARSVVGGPGPSAPRPPRSRPQSMMPPPTTAASAITVPPTAHENPNTAPSIPLGRAGSVRGHRRARSEQTDIAAAAVVGQMYRGRNSGGPISPTMMGPGNRQSAFSGTSYMSGSGRAPSLSSQPERSRLSSSDSVTSDPIADTASTGATSSSPRSSSGMNNYTGAVMTQSKLRPLRLVSETKAAIEEEEAARKKANRGSWIPWFNRPTSNGSEPAQT